MADDYRHLKYVKYEKLHKCEKIKVDADYDLGACLNGRCKVSYEDVTCSYRYQGIQAARGHLDIYNNIDIKEIYHLGADKGNTRPRIFAALSKKDARREVAINGDYKEFLGPSLEWQSAPPVSDKTKKVYKAYKEDKLVFRKNFWFVNFTVSSVPWPNQVHHVLNHSSLNKVIASCTKNIPGLVISELLKVKYNINHKDNAVILPTNEKWTRITGLPTHGGGHPNYSNAILCEVNEVLSGYELLNEQAAEPGHPKPDPLKVKEQLIKISKKWYKKILDVVQTNKNMSKTQQVIKVDDIK